MSLVAETKYREDRVFYQLADVPVAFYGLTDSSEVELGTINTGEDGKATLVLSAGQFLADTSGVARFEARFEGNEQYRKADRDLEVKAVNLKLETEIIDSVPTVTVMAEERKGDRLSPVEDADIRILVKRLYSDLPIREGSLDEGSFSTEFPTDLPGNAFGDLEIIARIVEHDDYGTVETRSEVRWGIPVSYALEERPRALWSRAPLWVIISVTVAFIAAWYHYALSLSKLLKVRKT